MIDTLTLSRELTKAGLESAIADAIATGIQQAAEHGDHVTSDQFKAGLADLRTEIGDVRADISRSESRIIKWVVGIVLTAAGIVTTAGVAVGLAILRALAAG